MAINIKARLFAEAVYLASSELSPDLTGQSRLIQHRFELSGEDLVAVRIVTDENGTNETHVPLDEWCEGVYETIPKPRLPRNLKPSAFGEIKKLVGFSVEVAENPEIIDAF